MTSVYRDSNSTVVFEHPYPGPLTATVYRQGSLVPILVSSPITPTASKPITGNVYELALTYNETQFDGRLNIEWTGADTFKRTTSVDVVTPLVPLSELRTAFTDTNWTDSELMELEGAVRTFVESYTRQSFGYEVTTVSVTGSGEKKLALPKRLISIESITSAVPGFFTLSNDGWSLIWRGNNYLTIKEMPPDEFVDNTVYVSGVIYVPDSYWTKFRRGERYDITGEWGYYTVPDDVREAAKILAADLASGDSLYRDRYLDQMKSGDWMLMFNKGAFRGTGNVRADHLLESYRREGMVII